VKPRRYASPDDVRKVFGDYHNALRWLALFLVGDEKLAEECVIDVCTIATEASPDFHEWLVHWAVHATFRSAFQRMRTAIAELARKYEKTDLAFEEHPPLSAKQFQCLVSNSEPIRNSLDVLCRFVLVMRGLAKDSPEQVSAELAFSQVAVERAYDVAFKTLAREPTETQQAPFPPLFLRDSQ